MTESTQGADPAETEKQKQEEKTEAERETYTFIDSGIRERHGYVPVWLQLVSCGLLMWGIYYMIRYWR
jgi:hypothetical protein